MSFETLSELYYGWFIFWITYFCGSLIFPTDKSVTRTNITKQQIIIRVLLNCLISASVIPFLCHIPQLISFSQTWYGYLYKYITLGIIMEIIFYYSHRLMHHRWFYKWHADHHIFIEPYALAGLYCSFIEMIFVNLLTIIIPFQILRFSLFEISIIMFLIAFNVMKGHAVLHSRNDIPNYLPNILIQSWDHDIHHRLMSCNYGTLYLLDRIHGTYINSS